MDGSVPRSALCASSKCRTTLSDAFLGIGRYDEAVSVCGSKCGTTANGRTVRSTVFTLMATSNAQPVFSEAGQCDKAVALEERTLEAQRRVLGPEHPETPYQQ